MALAPFPILTKVFSNSDIVTPIGSFSTAVEASGENLVNGIAQGNYILIAENDTAAKAILNSGSGNAIDKFIVVTQLAPVTATAVRIAMFICKKITIEVKDDKRYIRLTGPNKLYELTNTTLGNIYIAHRDTGTISASALDTENCRIIPGDADYKSDDYYNGWSITTDDGYQAIVETYLMATGHCSLSATWLPDDGTTPSAGANYELKNGVTTEDVDQVMEFAPAGWAVNYSVGGATGTQSGTAFVAAGESVFDGLKNIQEASGEVFWDEDGVTLFRDFFWVDSPQTGVGTFRNDVTQAQYEAGTYVVILELNQQRVEMDRVTRLSPYGNNYLPITLAEGLVSVPAGFSVNWANNLITNTAAETAGATIRYGANTWPSIKKVANDALPASEQVPEKAAAVALFNAAIAWMTAKAARRVEFVLKVQAKETIKPGRYWTIDYNGDISINESAFIHRVREKVTRDGMRETTVYLSTDHYQQPKNASNTVANVLGNLSTWQKHNVGGGGLYLGTTPTIVGGEGVTDHGLLTGLADDDHAQYLLTSGARTLTGNMAVTASVTIDGVDLSAHVLDPAAHHDPVTAGTHISLSGQQVSVTATSDGDTTPSTVLAGDANGRIRLDGLGLNTAVTAAGLQIDGDIGFIGPQQITTNSGDLGLNPTGDLTANADLVFTGAQSIKTSADDLTIAPATNLILDPVGDNVLFPTTVDTSGQNWVSGFLGTEWGIDTGLGHLDARSIYADELRVTLFSADETLVVAGTHWVTPGMAKISQDFVIPAVSSNATLYLRDSAALADTAVFREDDWVMIRVKDTTGGGLTLANVWGQVDNYSDETGGEQSWRFTTRSLGASVGGDTIPAESVVLGFGKSGDGWWSVTTNDLTSGPYAQIATWAGANPYTAANRTQHIRLGDLNGIAGIGHQYGLYAGVSPSGPRLIMSDTTAELHQIPLSLYSGTSDSGYIRIYALELNSSAESAIEPNGDISQDTVYRSTGTGTWYSHINENPASGQPDSQFIANTPGLSGNVWFNMEDISHTLTTLEVEAYITIHDFTDDVCTLVAQMFKSDGTTELSDNIKVANQASFTSGTGGLLTIPFTGIDTTASDSEWAAARLKLEWIYHVSGGTEVIRLEPSLENGGPYLAIGDTIPTGYWTGQNNVGLWVGRRAGDGIYSFRLGGGASDTTSPALTYSSNYGMQILNSDKVQVIFFDTSGNSYFSGVMTIDTAGAIRQGTGTWGSSFSGISILNSSGIGQVGAYNNDALTTWLNDDGITIESPNSGLFAVNRAYSFVNGAGTELGGVYHRHSTSASTQNLHIETVSTAGYDSVMGLYSVAGTGKDASTFITAAGDNYGADTVYINLASSDSNVYNHISLIGAAVYIDKGLNVGGSDAPTTGQLILNQGALDGTILECISSDFTDWSAQGMDSAGTYFQISKASGPNAGAVLRGAGDTNYGVFLIGSCQTADSTQSTSSYAPVVISGRVDNTGVGPDNNAVVMQSYNATRWIMKGDGQIYNDYYPSTMTNYDAEVDIGLVRASAYAIGGGGIIHDRWDEFVTYNRDDLARLDIVTKTGFVNQQNMTKLLIGNAWQQHTEVQELKERIAILEGMITG